MAEKTINATTITRKTSVVINKGTTSLKSKSTFKISVTEMANTIGNNQNDNPVYFSENVLKLKKLISKFIGKIPQTICFMFNQNHDLLIQEKSDDFDNTILFNLYKRLNNLVNASEEFLLKNKLLSIGPKIIHTFIENISGLYSDFKYLMLFRLPKF